MPKPRIIPHRAWQAMPRLGYAANAARRNIRAGDSLSFPELRIGVIETRVDSSGAKPVDLVRLRLAVADSTEERSALEGAAFNWRGFHVAIVAIYGAGELGAGLVALEVATLTSIARRSRRRRLPAAPRSDSALRIASLT